MSGTVWAIQPNGERISIEDWAYRAWREGRLLDPGIRRFLDNAVQINESPGWPRPLAQAGEGEGAAESQ